MSDIGEHDRKALLTDLDGRFQAELFVVRPIRAYAKEVTTGTLVGFMGMAKARYDKEIMKQLSRGMILAVRNFKAKTDERYTLLEVIRVMPRHFGMEGITEDTYYPFQHELAQQAVTDWEKAIDSSTMQIIIDAIPIGFDLTIQKEVGKVEPDFEKGWSHPILGDKVWILNEESVKQMYNKKVLKALGLEGRTFESDASEKNPRVGIIEMFEEKQIPIFVDFNRLVRFHFGIFSYTGGGKSNLVSNIIRRLIYHANNVNILIFDISSEYIVLLLDVLMNSGIPSMVVTDKRPKDENELFQTTVKPDTLQPFYDKIKEKMRTIITDEKMKKLLSPKVVFVTYQDLFQTLKGYGDRYAIICGLIRDEIKKFLDENGLVEADPIGAEAVKLLPKIHKILTDAKLDRYGPVDLPTFIESVVSVKKAETKEEEKLMEITLDKLIESTLKSIYRLIIINITDPITIRNYAAQISKKLLEKRRREFRIEPYILLVFDEAQEFIPADVSKADYTEQSSTAIENLLRHGRKYGLGGCIATQRIAHLNTNALQQLHTYFIGTLPRPYDRTVVADTFAIPTEILDKTLEFQTGEWLLSSYNATGIPNVPIFIKADNAEKSIESIFTV